MNIRKKFSAQLMVVYMFLGFVVMTIITSFIYQSGKLKEYSKEKEDLNKSIELAQEEIERLEKIDLEQNNNDIERIARESLHMVKENEIVYIDINKEIDSR